MVWASSMNRMIGVGDYFTSSISPFSRFSNSPLTPAPACSRARSKVLTVTLRSGGHVAVGYAQGKAFHHGGFAHACFADKDRIVLPAPREDVDNLPDLEVAAQYVVDLPGASVLRQVDCVLVEIGVLPPRGCAAPAPAAASVAPSSGEPATIFAKSRRSVSGSIERSSRLASCAIRCRSLSLTSASTTKPGADLGRAVIE